MIDIEALGRAPRRRAGDAAATLPLALFAAQALLFATAYPRRCTE